ncbi:MAG: helix-turn-helix domain-containing protein [Candidatus Latescibacterota bacterium]|nr:MAG: helix-turn-helix domain-containing protein [Candidatus Latescibacterota bacterium]
MPSRYLTTGKAASLLAVTPDTVLKWIRSGRLPALRTAGGHHRIDRRDLDRIISDTADTHNRPGAPPSKRPFEYCWQFYGNGSLPERCRGCAVYEMRAYRCYEVAKRAPQSGHLKAFCQNSCDECEYYRLVHEQRINVLVVTDDELLTESLARDAKYGDFNLEFANCEYVCSSKITNFRPDFAIVDCSLGHDVSSDISHHMVEDSRIPSVRVILAGMDDEFPKECDKEVFARMLRPFGIKEISAIIKGLQKGGGIKPEASG